jgi:hypothetical protein
VYDIGSEVSFSWPRNEPIESSSYRGIQIESMHTPIFVREISRWVTDRFTANKAVARITIWKREDPPPKLNSHAIVFFEFNYQCMYVLKQHIVLYSKPAQIDYEQLMNHKNSSLRSAFVGPHVAIYEFDSFDTNNDEVLSVEEANEPTWMPHVHKSVPATQSSVTSKPPRKPLHLLPEGQSIDDAIVISSDEEDNPDVIISDSE